VAEEGAGLGRWGRVSAATASQLHGRASSGSPDAPTRRPAPDTSSLPLHRAPLPPLSSRYEGIKINVIDTPGHADFGGEVERVLNMCDGVVLLVDSVEGPMPQTRFVTKKALQLNKKVRRRAAGARGPGGLQGERRRAHPRARVPAPWLQDPGSAHSLLHSTHRPHVHHLKPPAPWPPSPAPQVVVVVNKIDRPAARPEWVVDSTFELFMDLGANDEQCEFPVVFASGVQGIAGTSPTDLAEDLQPLFAMIVSNVGAHWGELGAEGVAGPQPLA
jgi:hypothetical protein